MGITLTESAAERVKKFLDERGKGLGLRLAVKATGCSGFAYVVDFADIIDEGDQVFESHGVKVIVAPDTLSYIEGTEIDYRRDGINENFQFNNPNVKSQCGCGESFNV